MELQLFIHKKIALHFYYSENSFVDNKVSVKNIFIYFPGLPQIIDEKFFEDKVDKDNAFFSVYYAGSWLSGGTFTYENCKKTVELAVKFVKDKKGIKTFDNKVIRWDYKKLHIMGYSFAGNPILSARLSKNDVGSIILFAPLIFLHRKETIKFLGDEDEINKFYRFNILFLKFLRRGYKFAFRGIENQSWDRYFSGKEKNSLIKLGRDFPDNIFIFHGSDDEKITPKSSEFFQKSIRPEAEVFIIKKVKHNLRQLCDFNKIIKIIDLKK
jgi:hypothetical protein